MERIALLCTGAQLPPAGAWIERAATVRAEGSLAVAAAVVERWFTPAYLEAHPDARSAHEQHGRDPRPPKATQAAARPSPNLICAKSFRPSPRPHSPIAGADDPATPPAKLEEIAARIPGARLLTVPHAAHLANAEQPGIITPALIEHLEQQ